MYFHFPFLGDESYAAAEASECANDQGKFWEYHDYLFANHNGENQGAFSNTNLKAFAKALNLDTAAFDACLDSGQHREQVQQDASFAQQLGVRSTPTFLVNGEPLLGAQPLSAFEEIINALNGKN